MNYYTQLDNVIMRVKQLRPDLANKLAQIENEITSDGALKMYARAAKSSQNSLLLSQWKPQIEKRVSAYLMKLNMLLQELPSSMTRNTMGWPFSDEELSPEQKHDIGLQVLQSYYDEAQGLSEFKYGSFDEFVNYLESKVPGYVQNIGDLVVMNSASTTVDGAKSRVADLARQSHGAANVSAIVQAAGGTGDSINWYTAIPDIAVGTGKDLVAAAVKKAGSLTEGISGTFGLLKYMPVILLAGGALFLWKFGGGLSSQAGGALRDVTGAVGERIRRGGKR